MPRLPLAGKRAGVERSDPSGSATGTPGYAQARVAVRVTLPSGVERTATVRSGPSGSATGALGAEWQCGSHCHLPVNVRRLNAQYRVAVRWVRSDPSGSATGTFGAEWQCGSHCHSPVNVRRLNTQGRVAVRQVRPGTLRSEWQCGPGPFVDLRALHRRWDGPASGEAIFYGPRQPLG